MAALAPISTHPAHVPSKYVDRYRSFNDYAEAPLNTTYAMKTFFGTLVSCQCQPNPKNLTCPESVGASPGDPDFFILNSEQISNFPATYIAVCDIDPIRDDGLLMYSALNEAG